MMIYLVTWDDLDLYYLYYDKKNRKWCLQMSLTLSMPIHWHCLRLTRAPLGGGLFRAPPLVFLRYLLNWCRYHRQTCSTLPPNIFTHCVKILKFRVSQFDHKWRQSDVMFRRFRAKIRVYGNRHHGCSFKATINFLIWNDVELVGLQNCYLGCLKFWKFLIIFKIFNNFYSFSKCSPSKSKCSKNRTKC